MIRELRIQNFVRMGTLFGGIVWLERGPLRDNMDAILSGAVLGFAYALLYGYALIGQNFKGIYRGNQALVQAAVWIHYILNATALIIFAALIFDWTAGHRWSTLFGCFGVSASVILGITVVLCRYGVLYRYTYQIGPLYYFYDNRWLFDSLLIRCDKLDNLLIGYSLILIIASFSGEWSRWIFTPQAVNRILIPEYSAESGADIGKQHVFQLKSVDFVFEQLPEQVWEPSGVSQTTKSALLQSIDTQKPWYPPVSDVIEFIKHIGAFFLGVYTVGFLYNFALPERQRHLTSEVLSAGIRVGAFAWTLYSLVASLSPHSLWIDNALDEPRIARIGGGTPITLPGKTSVRHIIRLPWPKTIYVFDEKGKLVDSARLASAPHYFHRSIVYNIQSTNSYHIEISRYRHPRGK